MKQSCRSRSSGRRGLRRRYPVAIDSDHSIWRGFENEAWPALYFVDSQGRVRRRQLGEGLGRAAAPEAVAPVADS